MSCSTTIPRMFDSNLRRNPRQRHASWALFVILTLPPLWVSFLLIDEMVQLPFLLVFWSCFAIALLNVVYEQHQSEMNIVKVVPLGTPAIGDAVDSSLLNKSRHISPLVNNSDNGRSSHDTSIPGILDLTTFSLDATDHRLRRDIGDEIF
jgi:hypothetical protein